MAFTKKDVAQLRLQVADFEAEKSGGVKGRAGLFEKLAHARVEEDAAKKLGEEPPVLTNPASFSRARQAFK